MMRVTHDENEMFLKRFYRKTNQVFKCHLIKYFYLRKTFLIHCNMYLVVLRDESQ